MAQFDFNLSEEGLDIALMGMAWNAGNIAAAKALKDVNDEAKAARDEIESPDGTIEKTDMPAIDRFNILMDQRDDDGSADERTEEQGHEPAATFLDYCLLLAAINDELTKRAQGKKWPKPQDITAILDWKCKEQTNITVKDNQIAETRALMAAFMGCDPKDIEISDEQLTIMTKEDRERASKVFAAMFQEHRAAIEDRMKAACMNYNRFKETSWETHFNNMPVKARYQLLGSAGYKLDDKCNELFTGKLHNGAISKGAGRPMLIRATEISVLRGDQKKVAAARALIEPQVV